MGPVPEHHRVLNPWRHGRDSEAEAQDDGDELTEFVASASYDEIRRKLGLAPIAKGLSPAVGNKRKRTAQLVGRLKRSRNYAKPVRGGTRRKRRL